MTRALVTQMLEAMDESRGDVSQCLQEELPKAGYERYDRRIKAITEQLEKHDAAIKAAREYLATEPSGERAELIERLNECLSGPAALTTREATAIKDAADMLAADAQQAKRVPMTNEEIDEIGVDYSGNFQVLRDFARAIEAHRDTPPAEKPTDWSAA